MLTAIQTFTCILEALRTALAARAAPDRANTAVLVQVWGYLGRAAARFEALFARWQAGTLPKPRPTRPARAARPVAARTRPRMPTRRAWIIGMAPAATNQASGLRLLLRRPEMAAFLAAAPQAGRLLRPLCHLLGLDPPAPLRPPPRPRRPRPPNEPPTRQGTPDRPLPANIRAAARAWRRIPA